MPHNIPRRSFLVTGATAAALGVAGAKPRIVRSLDGTLNIHHEPAREIPMAAHADVIVCGGGPAGIAAAVSAARSGATTQLIEANGCLGGVWTAGLLSNIIDYGNKSGIMSEILEKLDAQKARVYKSKYDIERMKLVLEEMCDQAGVKVRLHTRVCAVANRQDGHLSAVITESSSGREAFAGKMFVDCTGDGDVGALAGCRFDYGRPDKDQGQPMSYLVLLIGLDLPSVKPFVSGLPDQGSWDRPKDRLAQEIRRGSGFDPSYAHPTLFHLGGGLFSLMANHEYRVKGYDAQQLTEASMRGRREVHRMIDGLRSLGGPWVDVAICATPEHIGVREGRRLHGLYRISSDDLIRGARFDDAVCRATFSVDVHSTDPDKSKGLGNEDIRAKPYDIPYRSLIARDVTGLLMAGRCISGDFFAHASYRVTGNAVPMGEAAGAAAALAVQSNQLPQKLPFGQVKKQIAANSNVK